MAAAGSSTAAAMTANTMRTDRRIICPLQGVCGVRLHVSYTRQRQRCQYIFLSRSGRIARIAKMRARVLRMVAVVGALGLCATDARAQLETFVRTAHELAEAAGHAEPSRTNGI